jgi:hypothetical protein
MRNKTRLYLSIITNKIFDTFETRIVLKMLSKFFPCFFWLAALLDFFRYQPFLPISLRIVQILRQRWGQQQIQRQLILKTSRLP